MRRFAYALVAAAFAVGLALVAPTAQAAPGDEITRFQVDATVDTAGVFTVTQTIDVAYASPAHGPYLWFVTRQGYDDSHDRLITYDNVNVTSPTGAPADLQTTRGTNYIEIRVGNPNVTVLGTQTYVVTYTASGIVNPDVASSNMDEIYWNVIGTGWQIPIQNITVTIHSPATVSKTTCYIGADFTDPCASNASSGSTATYTQSIIVPGDGMAVVGGWPVGTFPDATVKLVPSSQNPFAVTQGGAYPTAGAGLVTVLAAWLLARFRKKGRDEQYANVTPGMLPAAGDKVEIKRDEIRDAPVEFAPPPGIPPRLAGAIVREGTADEDITASIVDLAVRGYIHMSQGQGEDFVLARTTLDPRTLNAVDQEIYDGLFATSPTMSQAQLSDQAFYATYAGFQQTLHNEFTAQKWYKADPKTVVARYRAGGFLIAAAGAGLSIYLGTVLAKSGILGIGWLAVPFVVLGLGMMILARRMPVRTPVGSAVAITSFGFRKYLMTAEADQIKWEEGQDIFSQYLPYAISFGVADRWAKIFQDLAARGAPVPQPGWYTGYYGARFPVWMAVTHSVGNIGTSFSTSVSQYAAAQARATGGSGGGSGFSGGGFGGGVGGGGGGTW